MAIYREVIAQNVVLVTDTINPSMFGQYWFIDKKIYKPEEMQGDSVFIPGFTSVSAVDSQITIVPNQIQMSIKDPSQSRAYTCIKNRLAKMVQLLDMIPVKAIGINFLWKVQSDEMDVHQLSKIFFGNNPTRIYDYFYKVDARLGAYFSQNYDGNTRLKLDVKPVKAEEEAGKETEFLFCSFNYHRDVVHQNVQEQLDDQLRKWTELRQNSNKVICMLE